MDTVINDVIDNSRKIKCPKCDKKFMHKDTITWHMREKHNTKRTKKVKEAEPKKKSLNEKIYSCQKCKKTLPTPSKLKRHEGSHLTEGNFTKILNELERQFECVKNKAVKYYLMIKAFKNIYTSMSRKVY